MTQPQNDLFLPVPDACVMPGCGLPRVEHDIRWGDGGPGHGYKPADPKPRPDRVASAFITTEWICTHCGAEQDVWGVADTEWMECSRCGLKSFLLHLVNDPEPKRSTRPGSNTS